MDWVRTINDAIGYMEQNLTEDIDRLVKEALDTDEVIIVR